MEFVRNFLRHKYHLFNAGKLVKAAAYFVSNKRKLILPRINGLNVMPEGIQNAAILLRTTYSCLQKYIISNT